MDKREMYSDDEIITVSFEDGGEMEVGIIGTFDVDGALYIALDDLSNDDAYLYRYIEVEDGFQLDDIPEDEFERVKQEFDELTEI